MPLFTDDTAFFRRYVPVTMNFSVGPLRPYLDQVEEDIRTGFLGPDLAAQLLAAAVPVQTDPVLVPAVSYFRQVVANLGFERYLPFAETQIGDDGVTISAADGRKAAFSYQTRNLAARLAQSGWQALDKLLAHLDEHEETFTAWADAPCYNEYRSSLFQSARQFATYYPIQGKCLTFRALRPFLTRAELTAADRLAQISQVTDQTRQTALMQQLRYAVAFETIAAGMPNLAVEISGQTLQVNLASQYGGASEYFTAPSAELLDRLGLKLRRQADDAWQTLDNALAALSPPPDTEDPVPPAPIGDKIVYL
ncbi:DUF6712 family protein [Arsenicibacter rosenii]|uniref:Uncharacterized protein n=1 Tax=Arsenicibacter rosenii TaxID=1750698 RepID=A0A1S2VM30_9BACT|nr:DUF6712 family protein [Arsenicibacter rosenii]OIN59813.1 hypothetical protein BLX24_08115 [Arsenicibacter rosenii]